jgi:hypothetical protein
LASRVGPADHCPLHSFQLPDAVHLACSLNETQKLQTSPHVADGKPGRPAQVVTLEVGLVSVYYKQSLAGPSVTKDQPFVGKDAILFHCDVSAVAQVVVANDQVQAILTIEAVQKIKHWRVCAANVIEAPVLPHLVAIADFDVGIAQVVVATHNVLEQVPVPGKSIGAAAVASMAVAEEYDPRGCIKGDLCGPFENPC